MSFGSDEPYVIRFVDGTLKVIIPGADRDTEIILMEGKNIERRKTEPREESDDTE